MSKIKLNIGIPKEGKTSSVEIDVPYSQILIGKKIGDIIDGKNINVEWKKLKITGGSDKSGVPMRADVTGGMKKKILISSGTGIKTPSKKGLRIRKSLRGNTITNDIYQVNLVITD